jgi:hypothetical protein
MLTDQQINTLAHRMNIPLGGCFFKDELPNKISFNKVYFVNLQDSTNDDGDENDGTHWTLAYVRETPNGTTQPIYFDPYGQPPPEIVKRVMKDTSGKNTPYTEKDIQSLMNNACGFYCLALGHFITSSKYRLNDLYEDVEFFLDMFDDLNTSVDWKKNEWVLKHFFLKNQQGNKSSDIDVFKDHSFFDKILDEDEKGGKDLARIPVNVKQL